MPSLASITSSSFSRDNTSALDVLCLRFAPTRTEVRPGLTRQKGGGLLAGPDHLVL